MKLPELEPICAIASPAGMGAISIIRVSGKDAIARINKLFTPKNLSKNLLFLKSHSMVFGHLWDEDTLIDEVLVSVFKNPHSYTGESSVEINCHGSLYIQQKILSMLHKEGIRLAHEGEFTLRAYLNKKLDLSQAEAVADLIASESAADHSLALQQMRGGFAADLKALRQELIDFTSLLELELDFSEEDVEFANRPQLQNLLQHLHEVLADLIQSFQYGNVIKEGVAVAIAGKPNAGKSSLLNALLKEDKAIVSDIAGTTRDAIEDTLILGGIKFRFIDTAGLRETEDSIEKIGVQKARDKVQNAKILLYLFDEDDTTAEEIIKDIHALHHPDLDIKLVQNKIDRKGGFFPSPLKEQVLEALKGKYVEEIIGLSTQNPATIAALSQALVQTVEQMPHAHTVVSNSRHVQALQHALEAIVKVQEGLEHHLSSELLAQDVRTALFHLGEITGEVDMDQDILGNIFSRFCIGK